MLVSSHDLSELEQVCDWLVLIDTGRSLYQGPTRDLLDGVAGGLAVVPERADDRDRLRDVLVAARPPRRRSTTTGSSSTSTAPTSPTSPPSVNRAAFDAGIVLVELSPLRTTLEDRYLSMVQGGAR